MRILTVVYDLDIGGTQRAAVAFANEYARQGHSSFVLVTEGRGSREGDLRPDVHLIDLKDEHDLPEELEPDVVHLHGHGLREEFVRSLHSRFPNATWAEQNVFAHVTPWTDLVDRTFLFSRWCEYQYASSPGLHASTALVPNPLEPRGFTRDTAGAARLRESLGIPPDALVVGRIGQPQHYKWSPLIVEAFESLASDDRRARLLLVGAPAEIVQRAQTSAFADRVSLVERVEGDDALRELYSAMDIFAHAALQGETFGYVLAEAALCEVPIVTLSTPWADNSQGEVVGHLVGGLVTTTAAGFVDGVRQLAGDPHLRARLGQQGRARVLERYEASVVSARALEALNDPSSPPAPRESHPAADYEVAADPPTGVRRWAARRGMWPTVAWLSGVQSATWLARTTLNRWGISRHGISQQGGGAR